MAEQNQLNFCDHYLTSPVKIDFVAAHKQKLIQALYVRKETIKALLQLTQRTLRAVRTGTNGTLPLRTHPSPSNHLLQLPLQIHNLLVPNHQLCPTLINLIAQLPLLNSSEIRAAHPQRFDTRSIYERLKRLISLSVTNTDISSQCRGLIRVRAIGTPDAQDVSVSNRKKRTNMKFCDKLS